MNNHDLKTRLKSEIDKIVVPENYKKMRNNHLLVTLGDCVRLIEQQLRYEQYDDAMQTAAEIAVKMAIYTDRGRV